MSAEILLISKVPDTASFATEMREQLGVEVEVAGSRRTALALLGTTPFSIIVLEQSLAERDPVWAEAVWQSAGLAIPLELNFSISARARLMREVKTALARRKREFDLARREAATTLANELRGTITGLLLQTQLTLKEPDLPASLAPKLHHLVDLASDIRERLRQGV